MYIAMGFYEGGSLVGGDWKGAKSGRDGVVRKTLSLKVFPFSYLRLAA
jgi:hypothetical protein